jgi:hypothetical protein
MIKNLGNVAASFQLVDGFGKLKTYRHDFWRAIGVSSGYNDPQ